MKYLLLIFLLTLTACGSNHLSVYTDYVNYENLASYHVRTPDPALLHPPFGQRVIVSWSIPRNCIKQDTYLLLTVRYRNREQEEKIIPLKRANGTFFHCLFGKNFCDKGGILTYKVQLFEGECLIEEWRHQLWAELILFEDPVEYEDIEDDEEDDTIDFLP